MQVFLELSGHPKANVQRVILSDTMTVGRSRACGLQIASAAVSRKHCEIRLNGERASVIDLGSSNGTFVDSERLPAGEERPLPPGCRLNIGGVRFIVRYEPAETERQETASDPGSLSAAIALAAASEAEEPLAVDEPLAADEPLPADEPLLADEPLVAENEPLVAEEKSSADEPILPDEPVLHDHSPLTNGRDLAAVSEEAASPEEPDLVDLFDDSPSEPSGAGPTASEEEPILADEEPILEIEDEEPILESEQEADEDQALAFLNEDEPSAAPRKRGEDSQLSDFLSQFGRD